MSFNTIRESPVLFVLPTLSMHINLLSGSWISPYTASRILEISLFVIYGTSTFLALVCYEGLLSLSIVEDSTGLYNKALSFLSYICTILCIDAVSTFLAAAILL
ncbi:hypothetical protein GCK32_019423, partial [Trichostrongylus colubriformis]